MAKQIVTWYFVSYSHSWGTGMAEIPFVDREITHLSDLQHIAKSIEETHNLKGVNPMAYQILRREEHEIEPEEK